MPMLIIMVMFPVQELASSIFNIKSLLFLIVRVRGCDGLAIPDKSLKTSFGREVTKDPYTACSLSSTII